MELSAEQLNEHLARLYEELAMASCSGKRINIAFSGGVDSRFLGFSSKFLGFNPVLYHFKGPHLSAKETEEALDWARRNHIEIHVIECNPLAIAEVGINRADRCYFCKKSLFSRLKEIVSDKVCDGTNHSDLGAYRPGLKALEELEIISPLANAQISKPEIRELAKFIGMDNPEQKSKPCMLTRFPYNRPIVKKEIEYVAVFEEQLNSFFAGEGKSQANFRIRLVEPEVFELHVLEADWNGFSDELKQKTEVFVKENFGLGKAPEIRPLERLSGYFDRKEKK